MSTTSRDNEYEERLNIPKSQIWHDMEKHASQRRKVRHKIMLLLLQKQSRMQKNHFISNLTSIAVNIERHLYFNAPSMVAYTDESTLNERLMDIAQCVVGYFNAARANPASK
eukprot:CAMPEP_0196825772 /NCGR_PEP_ID=MMETSP1362-20130617/93249_1 /TAXON_ID=163516 /ORGANISM="Leptocylindrus danicus, Strain CCMP1856" /LENGTH=111 /DNA_ID=CAMNT_0042206257 /DNA_START=602 /DNA_END=937 /DNA_ORIENTATION=+